MKDDTGARELAIKLDKFGGDSLKAIHDGVIATAIEVQNDARASIQREQSPGNIYDMEFITIGSGSSAQSVPMSPGSHGEMSLEGFAKRRGGAHQASAPGDAPNTDNGDLVRNIAFENPRQGLAFVGTSEKHGPMLELGTKRMDARPWLKPAMSKNKTKLQSNITNAIKEEINRVTKL